MKIGNITIDPAKSPGVLDTGSWNLPAAAGRVAQKIDAWEAWYHNARRSGGPRNGDRRSGGQRPDLASERALHDLGCSALGSVQARGESVYLLARLDDGQAVFLNIGPSGSEDLLGAPAELVRSKDGLSIAVHPTDAPVIHRFCRALEPVNAPRVLGATPRLGIGTRMTTRVWPGIFASMERTGYAANAVQNSVRELNLLSDMKEGRAPERNYAYCFGEIESGYTGSTFEGLWVAGTLAALLYPGELEWGADADHIQLKRKDAGLVRAKQVIDASRYYSFYTIDPADILDYASLGETGSGGQRLEAKIPDSRTRRDVLAYHREPFRLGGRAYSFDEDLIGRLAGKFWDSMEGTAALCSHITAIRGGEEFDLEYAFDEIPPEQTVASCISTAEEIAFVAREIRRRGLPVSHIAPNFGVEKGYDYRLDDGLDALGARVAAASALADDAQLLVDIHSADDLSTATRKTIGRAGKGRLHYKVSPSLQFVFTEVLAEREPELFRKWWDDVCDYARKEAEKGSPIATECLEAYRKSDNPDPSPHHKLFHMFYFAFPGRRDAAGRYANREELYTLPESFYAEYNARIAAMLDDIARDVIK
ncbi:MAG: hypothetical protein JW852_08205 [Spirochaetales bacterium]|nr:hypothetical protein [Spirochaetales bacterium]